MPAITRMLRFGALLTLSVGLVLGTHTQVSEASSGKSNGSSVSKRVKVKRLVKKKVHRAEKIALAQRGDAYSYGSAGPRAFDCSGLVYYSFRKAGLAVPRTSSGQAGHARRIPKSKLRRGDLMFFTGGSGVYHVGIFVGRGKHGAVKMLHSSTPGRPVQIDVPWTRNWFAGTMRRA